MFIQTEVTPNPATLKFIPGETVLEQGTAFFETVEDCATSPLAKRLFGLSGVSGVFFGFDFISVTLKDMNWDEMKPEILGAILDHYASGEPVMEKIAAAEPAEISEDGQDEETREIIAQIKELIEVRVRPAVARDGGDIIFHAFTDGIVYLRMQGACAGCPSSTATLQYGIQNLLKHYIPEVESVEAVQ